MSIQFQKAVRSQVALKIGIQGPSGSGKTKGALAVAQSLSNGKRVAVVDTENGSASLYADQFDFDTITLSPPYTSARYLECMRAAIDGGYGVVVLDSISHQWNGEGGIVYRKDIADQRPGSNHFTNWVPFTKEHEEFKAAILNAPIHIISTLRTKQDYVMVEGQNGKQKPKKVGLAPIQRDGMEYEFAIMWELQMDHMAASSKDRTELFEGKLTNLLDRSVGDQLLKWLSSAAPLNGNGHAPPPSTNGHHHSAVIPRDGNYQGPPPDDKPATITPEQWKEVVANIDAYVDDVTSRSHFKEAMVKHFKAARAGELKASQLPGIIAASKDPSLFWEILWGWLCGNLNKHADSPVMAETVKACFLHKFTGRLSGGDPKTLPWKRWPEMWAESLKPEFLPSKDNDPAPSDLLNRIDELTKKQKTPAAVWADMLKRNNVADAAKMTTGQATAIIAELERDTGF